MKIKRFNEYKVSEDITHSDYGNYETEEVHISSIKVGDTVKHNGEVKTVTSKDIPDNSFMGHSLFGDSYKLGRTPVKKVNFVVTEGIDSEGLNPTQQAALDELKSSDVSLFDERDFQSYADKIGVTIEQVMELVGDGGTSTHAEEPEVQEPEVQEVDEELETLVQTELIDSEDVDSGNLDIKIQELVDRLESDDYYEWGDEEWDEYIGKYETLVATIKRIYTELSGANNPNQVGMKFESIKRFDAFVRENHGELRKGALFFDHILQGSDATEENAYQHARGLDWASIHTEEGDYPYLSYIDTVNGVGIYYNFGSDSYYFTDETNETV